MKKLLTLLLSLALTSFTDTLLRYGERMTACPFGYAENQEFPRFSAFIVAHILSLSAILPSSNEEGFML